MDDLKPCPFCGSRELHGGGGGPWWIRCATCGTDGPSAGSQRKARTLWNRRDGDTDGRAGSREQARAAIARAKGTK